MSDLFLDIPKNHFFLESANLTSFIENQSFFDNSFDRYPIGEKTEVADSEKRTPEAKFRPFIFLFSQNPIKS